MHLKHQIRRGIVITALVVTGSLIGNTGGAYAEPTATAEQLVAPALAAAPSLEVDAGPISQNDDVTASGVTIRGSAKSDTVSRKTEGGGQVLTVLRNKGDQAVFDVDLPPGAHLTKSGEAVLIVGKDELLGAINAPWAVDANGTQLPTSYEIRGQTLVQKVDTSKAELPVVADPSFWLCDWNTTVCMKLNRDETRRITDSMFVGVGVGTAVGALCGIIPWMPPYLGAVKAACAGIVAAYFFALRNTFATAKAQGRCVQLKFNHIGGVFLRHWSVVSC